MAFKSKRPGRFCGRQLDCGEPAKIVESPKKPRSLPSYKLWKRNEIAAILVAGPKTSEESAIGGKLLDH
jgi:hypothetical protein